MITLTSFVGMPHFPSMHGIKSFVEDDSNYVISVDSHFGRKKGSRVGCVYLASSYHFVSIAKIPCLLISCIRVHSCEITDPFIVSIILTIALLL